MLGQAFKQNALLGADVGPIQQAVMWSCIAQLTPMVHTSLACAAGILYKYMHGSMQ